MPRWFQHLPRILVTLLPVLVAALHASGVARLEILDRLETVVYDLRLKSFMPQERDDRIVIVDIDEESLAQVGRWPWSRRDMAQLVNVLFEQQRIAVLGFDIVFVEADNSSGFKQLQALASNELRGQNDFVRQLPRLRAALDYDAQFAKALADRPVVMGYYLTSDRQGLRAGQLPEPVVRAKDLQGRRFSVYGWNGYGSNLPVLAQAAPVAGFFNSIVDPDGVIRSIALLAELDGQYYESLALGMYRQVLDMPRVHPGFAPGQYIQGSYQNLESLILERKGRPVAMLPVNDRVAALIPFRGNGGPQGGTYRYISAGDLLQGKLAPGELSGRLAILGTTAPGLMDMRATPVSAVYPGAEIHANLLSAMLDGQFLIQPDYAAGFNLLVIVIVGIGLALLLPHLSALWAMLASLGIAAALAGLNVWFHTRQGLALPVTTSLLMVGMAFAVNMSYGYFVESRSKRALGQLFGSYVPPELVDEMVKDPDRYSMQAREQELTVMFSDMRGFTSLSETMAPAALQHLLNDVFTRLTRIIRAQRGTIDKYMGDCVMAFWGAPVEMADHARRSVQAALQMRQAIVEVNEAHRRQGIPTIGMGVGLNTGPMFVGDMGSDVRRSYTVIGDAVNLGSRLEGLSKYYGVDIVASGATRAQAGEGFVWQELDKVKVKGKDEAVTIHTIRGLAQELTPEQDRELALWERCLAAYRTQSWPEAAALAGELQASHPESGLYRLYAERIETRRQQPADPHWDGSTQFDTK